MGKSPDGNYQTPQQWTPPANLISQQGQTATQMGNPVPSFLPGNVDPVTGQAPAATGLTQDMMNSINTYAGPPPAPAPQAASQPSAQPQGLSPQAQMLGALFGRDFLAQIMNRGQGGGAV